MIVVNAENIRLFAIIVLAVLFGIFPHYLMDPITVACYDILNFMGAV